MLPVWQLLLVFVSYGTCMVPEERLPTDITVKELVEHEKVAHLSEKWKLQERATDDTPLRLQVVLAQYSKDHVAIANKVSDPASDRYGQFLTAAELQSITGASESSVTAIKNWLQCAHATDIIEVGNKINFKTTVGRANELLAAEFAYYSSGDKAPIIRTTSYSIPRSLEHDIDFIFPTVHFFDFGPREQNLELKARQHGFPTGPVTCDGNTCPQTLVDKYDIDYTPPDKSSSRLGVAGFLEQYPNHVDVDNFLREHGFANSSEPSHQYKVESINGGLDPSTFATSGVEAMLDLEYSMAFTGPLEVTYFSTGGRPPTLSQPGNVVLTDSESFNEPFEEFIEYLLKMEFPPQVISISYTDNEQDMPLSYAAKVCDLFAQLATRGVSVILASGDGGASGTRNSDCLAPDGKTHQFLPTFPASCPWVTTMGALHPSGSASSYSSGGFSNIFDTPEWQQNATSLYIEQLNGSHTGWYNASGRGYPDVTLLGNDYVIISSNYTMTTKGTSASTPVFAAWITIINDLRIRAGKPVLGFLNPILYSAALKDVYTDVTSGYINGCAYGDTFEVGFGAISGWDAASGLGEPNFKKMRLLLS